VPAPVPASRGVPAAVGIGRGRVRLSRCVGEGARGHRVQQGWIRNSCMDFIATRRHAFLPESRDRTQSMKSPTARSRLPARPRKIGSEVRIFRRYHQYAIVAAGADHWQYSWPSRPNLGRFRHWARQRFSRCRR
jgi:hypothetical protein